MSVHNILLISNTITTAFSTMSNSLAAYRRDHCSLKLNWYLQLWLFGLVSVVVTWPLAWPLTEGTTVVWSWTDICSCDMATSLAASQLPHCLFLYNVPTSTVRSNSRPTTKHKYSNIIILLQPPSLLYHLPIHYHRQREGNVFSPVCPSTGGRGGCTGSWLTSPVQGTIPAFPLYRV